MVDTFPKSPARVVAPVVAFAKEPLALRMNTLEEDPTITVETDPLAVERPLITPTQLTASMKLFNAKKSAGVENSRPVVAKPYVPSFAKGKGNKGKGKAAASTSSAFHRASSVRVSCCTYLFETSSI